MRAGSLFYLTSVLYHQHQLFIVIERENIPCVLHRVSFIELLAMINQFHVSYGEFGDMYEYLDKDFERIERESPQPNDTNLFKFLCYAPVN